ncbi:MAG: hypothetical protein F6K40_29075 [Okeania sp. SIO3I5]|uniref:hypothetical protein n=1 Tax=Okeania sp. SIO3I5 TaxID=2607805 RepID=UPI0013BD0025|nr:hypothetical protein [Okeania sp. SIO3I5]NEQ40073.1 hypothetical protein [Okeania sp. SIO3I5]
MVERVWEVWEVWEVWGVWEVWDILKNIYFYHYNAGLPNNFIPPIPYSLTSARSLVYFSPFLDLFGK